MENITELEKRKILAFNWTAARLHDKTAVLISEHDEQVSGIGRRIEAVGGQELIDWAENQEGIVMCETEWCGLPRDAYKAVKSGEFQVGQALPCEVVPELLYLAGDILKQDDLIFRANEIENARRIVTQMPENANPLTWDYGKHALKNVRF